MPRGNPGKPKPRWEKVKEGRAAFARAATAYVALHRKAIKQAIKAGKEDIALQHTEWALKHIAEYNAETQSTERVIGTDIDQVASASGSSGVGVQVLVSGFPSPPTITSGRSVSQLTDGVETMQVVDMKEVTEETQVENASGQVPASTVSPQATGGGGDRIPAPMEQATIHHDPIKEPMLVTGFDPPPNPDPDTDV